MSETWLTNRKKLVEENDELKNTKKIGLMYKNRPQKSKRNPGGGIGIFFKEPKIKMVEHKFRRGTYEIVAAGGKSLIIPGQCTFLAYIYIPK